jgi:hypothetical protein
LVGVTSGAKGQLIELIFDGRNNLRVGKTNLVEIIPVKVNIATSLQILYINTLAGLQGIKAWG